MDSIMELLLAPQPAVLVTIPGPWPVPKTDPKLCIEEIYCNGKSGQFTGSTKGLGWKTESSTSLEILDYEWATIRRAEWFQGKLRVEISIAEEEEGVPVTFEGFGKYDLLSLQKYFQQHSGIQITVRTDSPASWQPVSYSSRKIGITHLKQWNTDCSSFWSGNDDIISMFTPSRNDIIMEGWVWKQSRLLKRWRRRWMTLTRSSIEWQARPNGNLDRMPALVEWLEGKAEEYNLDFIEKRKQENSTTTIADVKSVVGISGTADLGIPGISASGTAYDRHFSVTCEIDTGLGFDSKTFHLSCETAEQKAAWMEKIQMVSGLRS
jgi:hypothetical protein